MAAPMRPDRPAMTLAQFLWWEREQLVKHEFVDGQVRAMTGTTEQHAVIVGNVYSALREAARGSSCRAYPGDLQIRSPAGRVYYPDAALGCGPRTGVDRHVRAPCVIVEVTSLSTQHVDRGEKLHEYRTIPSLQAYLIVDHTTRRVECHLRGADGAWRELVVADATGTHELAVPCVDAVLSLDGIYEDTDLRPPSPDVPPDEPLPPGDLPAAS